MMHPSAWLRDLQPFNLFLVQGCLIVTLPYLAWRLLPFRARLPLPVVQMIVAIALGPAILGALASDIFVSLFAMPAGSGAALDAHRELGGIAGVATIALCLVAFVAGADTDRKALGDAGPRLASIGLAGAGAAFLLVCAVGSAATAALPIVRSSAMPAVLFSIAFGLVIMAVSRSVLASAASHSGMPSSQLTSMALICAGMAERLLWPALVLLLAAAASEGSLVEALARAAGASAASALVVLAAGPELRRLHEAGAEAPVLTLAAAIVFVASAIAGLAGLHPVIGAYVAGLLMPEGARSLAARRLDQPTMLVLLPFLALLAGLRMTTDWSGGTFWWLVLLGLLACIMKSLIYAAVVRVSGESTPFAMSFGLLQHYQWPMGLVLCSALYDKRLLPPPAFTALLVALLAVTVVTPLLQRRIARRYGAQLGRSAAPDAPIGVSVPIPSEPIPHRARIELAGADGPIWITQPTVTIGRHSQDDIHLDDTRISRHHARLTVVSDGSARIVNLTADRAIPNPITVNGVDRTDAEIKSGDRICLGGVEFTYYEADAAHHARL